MVWTNEKIQQLPEIYRDFMFILKPVIDSKRPGAVLRITGIPFGRIVGALTSKYDYDAAQVRQLADNLRQADYIMEDTLGFFQPTGKGETLIVAMANPDDANDQQVPPLPSLKE
jgi:hypothetical protein